MHVGIGAGVGLVLALRTVLVAVAFPRLRDAPARKAAEVVLGARALGAVHRLVRAVNIEFNISPVLR